MLLVTVFFVFFNVVLADVYFTMADLRVAIPSDRARYPPQNHPLVSFYAKGDSSMTYSVLEGGTYLKVFRTTGDVLLTRDFREREWKAAAQISATISVADTIGNHNRTSLAIDILNLVPLDCDFIIEDLCFWKAVHYRIAEDSPSTILGSLAPPFLAEMCPTYKISYNLISKNGDFILILNGTWSVQTQREFDREMFGDKRNFEVLCTVENSKKSSRNVTRKFQVEVLDVDDNPIESQENVINVSFSSNLVHKGHFVESKYLIFHDRDSPAVNNYEVTVLNDSLKILRAICKNYENDRKGPLKTAVHCKLEFTRNTQIPQWTYSVIMQLNDTTLIKGNKVVQVQINLHFHNETGYHPKAIKKQLREPLIYPSNSVRVFRTAGPLARITQPDPKHLKGAQYFTIHAEGQARDVFNVTSHGGIVFVHDYLELRDAPKFMRLNISFKRDGKRLFDELEIQILDEPINQTCLHMNSSLHDWPFCAEFATPDECLSPDSCALSTGGSSSVEKREKDGEGPQRCMWRGDKNPSKDITPIYSTCTPDVKTCPDGKCDELEELNDFICPQDCITSVDIPTTVNQITGRGISKGSGVCSCSTLSCRCHTMKKKNRRKSQAKYPNSTYDSSNNHENTSRHSATNITSASSTIIDLGKELARCGTTCVLGIVAGILFLAGAVALVVICWKLDRVQKLDRGNLNDENRELAAPLAAYISRNVPDTMPINFDMTTSLADIAILNIINKYEPDPKWEFPRNQLIIEQTLGEGEFGRVLRAKALNIAGQPGYNTVAVKTLKDDARETELNDLLSEYQLLKEVSHPNVIRLLGVCTAPGGPIYLIIEFAEHGSLRNYLRRSRHLKAECGRLPSSSMDDCNDAHYDEPNVSQMTPKEILSFAWQICKGMAYLCEIKLVHRDLAARNVLLAADKICKISDFGLTRDIYEDDAYFKRSKGRVPVKWMAPESLADHVYTNKSDVWSFGILLWELATLGATPYPGIAVQNLFHLLRQGYRMERPDNCSPTLDNIMRSCWHIEPEQRPTFQELAAVFEKMLSDDVEYLDLTNNAIHNRSYFCSPFEDNTSTCIVAKQNLMLLEPLEKFIESNPLNYLTKSQSYIKCGSSDKFQATANILNEHDSNQNDIINTQGYETPVKVSKKVQTPTNDSPQYYTDMAGKNNVNK